MPFVDTVLQNGKAACDKERAGAFVPPPTVSIVSQHHLLSQEITDWRLMSWKLLEVRFRSFRRAARVVRSASPAHHVSSTSLADTVDRDDMQEDMLSLGSVR